MDAALALQVLMGAAVAFNSAACGIGLLLSRQARHATDTRRAIVWFRYLRAAGWMTPASILLWLAIFFAIATIDVVKDLPLGESIPHLITLLGLLAVPPFLAPLLFSLASRPVPRILRGVDWTAGEVVRQWFWSMSSVVIPTILVVISLPLALEGQPRLAAALGGVSVLLFFLGSNRRNDAYGIELRALDSGELRDRVFELARMAGVSLRGLLILRGRRGPVMNAFAASGGTIMLAEDLVASMPRAELDAIIAHELGHLRHKHIPVIMLAVAVPAVVFGFLNGLMPDSDFSTYGGILALPVIIGISGSVSRRAERAADRTAAAILQDPDTAIRMLARLTRLNLLPARWTGWDAKAMCHPSLEERAASIADHFNVPRERVRELLTIDESSMEPYSLPVAHKQSEWVTYRQRSGVGALAVYLATTALPPVAGVWLGPLVPAVPLWASIALMTFCAALLLPRAYSRRGFKRLEGRIRTALGEPDGTFVGLRPDREPRLYSWYPFWDLGFVDLRNGVLTYMGEQTRFALAPDDVMEASTARAAVVWFGVQAVSLKTSCATPTFVPVPGTKAARLLAELQTWVSRGGEPVHLPLQRPEFPPITSTSPQETALSLSTLIVWLLAALASLAATAILAPEWSWMPVLVSVAVVVTEAIPAIMHDEPRTRDAEEDAGLS